MITWSVWMRMPVAEGGGFSRIAGDLTQEQAELLADRLLFPGRAMPDATE